MRTKSFILAAAALAASVSLASATTITQTESYGPQTTDWGSPTRVPLDFAGFDNSLGTLTGVFVVAKETFNGTITNRNLSSVTATIATTLTNSWDAYLPTPLNSVSDLASHGSTNAVDIESPLATGATHPVSGYSPNSDASISGDNLVPYEGAFVIGTDDIGSTSTSATTTYYGTAAYTDLGELSVTVTYTYHPAVPPPPVPTPEPATLALLGSSLFGLGLIRR